MAAFDARFFQPEIDGIQAPDQRAIGDEALFVAFAVADAAGFFAFELLVEVVEQQVADFAFAETGAEHESDDGVVPAGAQGRFALEALGRRAQEMTGLRGAQAQVLIVAAVLQRVLADAGAAWVDVVLYAQEGFIDQRFAVGRAQIGVLGAVAAGQFDGTKQRIAQSVFTEQVLIAAADGGEVGGDGAGGEVAFMEEIIAVMGEVGAVPELLFGIQPGDEFAKAMAVVAVGVRLQERAVGGGRSERGCRWFG